MARLILTTDLKQGMVVVSQRTVKQVYSFGTDLDQCRTFPMRGKAIVLRELTKVQFAIKKSRWNASTGRYDQYDALSLTNMLLLSHYKHGLVMYFARREDDQVWRLVPEKEGKVE